MLAMPCFVGEIPHILEFVGEWKLYAHMYMGMYMWES